MSIEIQVPIISLPTDLEGAEMINLNAMCRLCGSQNNRLVGLYSEESISNDIPGKINLYLPIKVTENDQLSLQCCWQCVSTVQVWHELFVTSVELDQKLKSFQLISEKEFQNMNCAFEESNEIVTVSTEETFDTSDASNYAPVNDSESESKGLTFKEETNHFTCSICKQVFKQKSLLAKHISKTHLIKRLRKRGKNQDLIKDFQCNACEKSYTKKHDLSRHLEAKHGIKPNLKTIKTANQDILDICRLEGSDTYECDICATSFNKSYNLLRHRTVHSGEKRYCCKICGKSFRLNMSLTRHIKEVHNDTRQVECAECGKGFKNKWSLQQHLFTHKESKGYVCDVCGKSFKQPAGLFVHKKYHKDSSLKCQVCGKGFKMKHNLEKHLKMHSGRQDFMCGQCEKRFSTKFSLSRHMTRCHVKLICEECGCEFEQKRYLRLHKCHRQQLKKLPK